MIEQHLHGSNWLTEVPFGSTSHRYAHIMQIRAFRLRQPAWSLAVPALLLTEILGVSRASVVGRQSLTAGRRRW